jgi:hypothetical protein
MHTLITRLSVNDIDAADAEVSEMDAQAGVISKMTGFRAVLVIRITSMDVVVFRVFDSAEGIGRSLGGPLRPDLAARFATPPVRQSGEVAVARFSPPTQ